MWVPSAQSGLYACTRNPLTLTHANIVTLSHKLTIIITSATNLPLREDALVCEVPTKFGRSCDLDDIDFANFSFDQYLVSP